MTRWFKAFARKRPDAVYAALPAGHASADDNELLVYNDDNNWGADAGAAYFCDEQQQALDEAIAYLQERSSAVLLENALPESRAAARALTMVFVSPGQGKDSLHTEATAFSYNAQFEGQQQEAGVDSASEPDRRQQNSFVDEEPEYCRRSNDRLECKPGAFL